MSQECVKMLTERRGWLVRKRFRWGENHQTQNKTPSSASMILDQLSRFSILFMP